MLEMIGCGFVGWKGTRTVELAGRLSTRDLRAERDVETREELFELESSSDMVATMSAMKRPRGQESDGMVGRCVVLIDEKKWDERCEASLRAVFIRLNSCLRGRFRSVLGCCGS
jgi:hypothetical protein